VVPVEKYQSINSPLHMARHGEDQMPKKMDRCHNKVPTIRHGRSNRQPEFVCIAVAEISKSLRLQFYIENAGFPWRLGKIATCHCGVSQRISFIARSS
jgi:hypothetical protein